MTITMTTATTAPPATGAIWNSDSVDGGVLVVLPGGVVVGLQQCWKKLWEGLDVVELLMVAMLFLAFDGRT